MTPEETAFRRILDADPCDKATRFVLADFLEDRGDVRYELHRLLAARKLWPTLSGSGRWWEWCFHPAALDELLVSWYLPGSIFACLGRRTRQTGVIQVKQFATLLKALNALETAFAKWKVA